MSIKLGDKVEMYLKGKLIDTGTVVAKTNKAERSQKNHVKVVFLKNPIINKPFMIPLNRTGSINQVKITLGFTFKEKPYQWVRDKMKILAILRQSPLTALTSLTYSGFGSLSYEDL